MPGTRQNAMGGAFSSVADDPYAVFYNPAGLSKLTDIETGFSLGRRMSPLAGEGEAAFVYARPSPDNANQVAGFGYYAVRQGVQGSRDAFSVAMGSKTTIKYFQKPILYGGGIKLIDLRYAQTNHIGLGFDGGLLLESNSGLKTSLVLTDVVLGLERSLATITLGNSYRYGNTVFALDLRKRGRCSKLFMGAERDLFNGLLQARAGKGFTLDGADYLALGLGVNTLPLALDFTWSLPWKGFNQPAGFYGLSAAYRFGSPSFSEKLVGKAGRRAEELKTRITNLRVQEDRLRTSVETYRANKGMLETDLTMMQTRLRGAEEQLKNLELEILEAQGRKEKPKPAKKYVPPPPEKWPRLHKVEAGETLRSIASKYYGNPNLWERVYQANEKYISKGLPVEGAIFTIPAPPPEGR
jgi:LysM repeat protein